MTDISKLTLPNGATYSIKDAQGRNLILEETTRAKSSETAIQNKIDALSKAGYRFMGVAHTTTNPGTPSDHVFYIASEQGEYQFFVKGTEQNIGGETLESYNVYHNVASGEVKFFYYSSDNGTGVNSAPIWKEDTLDLCDAVTAIVKNKLIGVKGGVAPLDATGTVPAEYLKNKVVMIDYWILKGGTAPEATQENIGQHYYDETTAKLYISEEYTYKKEIVNDADEDYLSPDKYTDGDTWYVNKTGWHWVEEEMSKSALYVDKTQNITYRYDGTKLVSVGIGGDTGILCGRMRTANFGPSDQHISITALTSGYFGIGTDSSGVLSERVFIPAGETYTFTHFTSQVTTSTYWVYIYSASNIAGISFQDCVFYDDFDFSVLKNVRNIEILDSGARGIPFLFRANYITNFHNLYLGNLTQLNTLKIEYTGDITYVDSSKCPKLSTIDIMRSLVERIDLAKTDALKTLKLSYKYKHLVLQNQDNIETIDKLPANYYSIETLVVDNDSFINNNKALTNLVKTVLNSPTSLKTIRITKFDDSGDGSVLTSLATKNLSGLDSNLNPQAAPVLNITYWLTKYTNEKTISEWESKFSGLNVRQKQYTLIEMDDTKSDPQNITNLENNTSGNSYVPCAHVSKIVEEMIPYVGKLDTATTTWKAEKGIDNEDSGYEYADGDESKEAMMYVPHLWYKGINDFKNQKKYIAWSTCVSRPESIYGNECRRNKLSELTCHTGKAVMVGNITEGSSKIDDSGVLMNNTGYNTYETNFYNVGEKLVRWPGVNSGTIGACFLNSDGVIISKFNMNITDSQFDFVEGDYIFTEIPDNASRFVFTVPASCTSSEVIVSYSTDIESIEPDWVESKPFLVGLYQVSGADDGTFCSAHGKQIVYGSLEASGTYQSWEYDTNGNPTNIPEDNDDTCNFSAKDMQNYARKKGTGYQLIDYEMSKLLTILFYSWSGTRDAGKYCGYGKKSDYELIQEAGEGSSPLALTGYLDSIGKKTSTNLANTSGQGNKVLGLESFFGCNYEWMDMVAVNVPSFIDAYKAHMVGQSNYPIDGKFHIYDPISKTERVVQGLITTSNGTCVARTKHGRYCDIIPSKLVNDKNYATYYTDGYKYNSSTCRFVLRSASDSEMKGGVAFIEASMGEGSVDTRFTSRLAYRGPISLPDR